MPKPRILDENSIQIARKRFNRRLELKWKSKAINFDQMFGLFSSDCVSFTEIAEAVDLSRERARQLYKTYFASLFPNRPSGRARQKMCILKTNQQRARDFSDAPAALSKIAEIARAYGYSVKKIPSSNHGNRVKTFNTTTILINGKVCRIHYLRNIFPSCPHSKLSYTRLKLARVSVEKCDFVIIIRQIGVAEQMFLIPAKILLENWGCGVFYIRGQKTSAYPNRHSRIDFWQYLDAWHLLGRPETF